MARLLALYTVAAGLSLGAYGCGDRTELRLVVERDTLALFGSEPTRLPLRLVDRAGIAQPLRGVELELADRAATVVKGDSLVCVRNGVTRLRATVDGQFGEFITDCRLGASLEFPPGPFIELRLGAPVELAVYTKARGIRERVAIDTVLVADTAIAVVRDSTLLPRTVGRTRLTLAGSGVRIRSSVSVSALVAADTLSLVPGEFRSWPLDSGRYQISVTTVSGPPAFAGLKMETEGAKCVRDPARDDTIHCVVYARGGVGVRNLAASGTGPGQRTAFQIVRAP